MKKIVLFLVLALSLLSTHAQIAKGQWLIGGSGSFTSNEQNSSLGGPIRFEGRSYSIAPNVGYFAVDKLAVGLRPELEGGVLYESGVRLSKDFSYALAPFLRYYFLPQKTKINPYADAHYYFRKWRGRGTSDEVYKETTNGYKVSGGAAFFVHPKVALEAQLTYRQNTLKGNGDIKGKAIVGSIGFQIHL